MRERKSTLRITLVLIGTAAVSACDSGPRYTSRDIYASAEDCQRDWGDPRRCEPAYRSSSGTAGGGRVWYGPSYDSDIERPHGARAIGTTSIQRGGFGSSSLFHGSGG